MESRVGSMTVRDIILQIPSYEFPAGIKDIVAHAEKLAKKKIKYGTIAGEMSKLAMMGKFKRIAMGTYIKSCP